MGDRQRLVYDFLLSTQRLVFHKNRTIPERSAHAKLKVVITLGLDAEEKTWIREILCEVWARRRENTYHGDTEARRKEVLPQINAERRRSRSYGLPSFPICAHLRFSAAILLSVPPCLRGGFLYHLSFSQASPHSAWRALL